MCDQSKYSASAGICSLKQEYYESLFFSILGLYKILLTSKLELTKMG